MAARSIGRRRRTCFSRSKASTLRIAGGVSSSLAQEAHRALRATGIDLAPRAWRSMFFIRFAGSVGIGFTHGSI
jgi:hypothetical protein